MAKGYPVAKSKFKYTEWPKQNERLVEAVLTGDNIRTKEKTETKISIEEKTKPPQSLEDKSSVITTKKLELFDE
jgi:hypothetical protein